MQWIVVVEMWGCDAEYACWAVLQQQAANGTVGVKAAASASEVVHALRSSWLTPRSCSLVYWNRVVQSFGCVCAPEGEKNSEQRAYAAEDEGVAPWRTRLHPHEWRGQTWRHNRRKRWRWWREIEWYPTLLQEGLLQQKWKMEANCAVESILLYHLVWIRSQNKGDERTVNTRYYTRELR